MSGAFTYLLAFAEAFGRFARSWSLLGLALAAVFLPLAVGAEELAGGFETANRLYEKGQYSDAAAAYEKLLATGKASAALYFNLGNAWFKAGQVGRAIAAYRKAEQLSPRDPDLRANLQFARNQVQPPTRTPSSAERWLARLSLNEWGVAAAGALWLILLLLTALQWRPALLRAWRTYLLALAAAAACLCVLLAVAVRQRNSERVVVVVSPDAVVRQGPLEEAQAAFTAHNGAELRVLDEKGEWFQVTTDPRRIGWLRRDQAL